MALNHEYRLRLGRAVIALTGLNAGFAGELAQWFAVPSDPAAATIRLRLVLRDDGTDPPVPNSLILTKRADGRRFDIADGLVRGEFDAATGESTVEVHAVLTRGRLRRVLEQALYQAFHSACRRLSYDAGLVHACGVIDGGGGHLFVGRAGAGKTTVARLSQGRHVVNDEMPLVEFRDDGPWLVGTPFNGFFRDKTPGEAPLVRILLLDQGPAHALSRVGPGEAAATIAAEIAPPVPLPETAGEPTRLAMLETATRLALAVPVRRLTFKTDPGFWAVIAADRTAS